MKKELTEVKRESHKRKKLLIAQQQLMHAGAGSYNKVGVTASGIPLACYFQVMKYSWQDSSVGRASDQKARCSTEAGSVLRCSKGFFSRSQLLVGGWQGGGGVFLSLSVQVLFQYLYSLNAQSHASTSALMLRIPNTGRGIGTVVRKKNSLEIVIEQVHLEDSIKQGRKNQSVWGEGKAA